MLPPATLQVLEGVRSFDELLVTDVRRIDCTTFVRGRAALIGDAAHAMAPNAAQGANSALVDAAVLRLALARAADPAAALAWYDARRRPKVHGVQRTSDLLARLAHARTPTDRALRAVLLGVARLTAGSRRAALAVMQEDPAQLYRLLREDGGARP